MNRPKVPLPRPSQISPERKWIYYTGMALSALGLISFLSTFVTFAMHFGDFTNFAGNARSEMLRGFGGMVLIVVGGIVMAIGARGPFGSGILLDPEQAGRDLEPWAKMSGRLQDAAFSEMHTLRETIAGVGARPESDPEPEAPEVKVRCRNCQALNDEDARFCGQCGASL